MGGVLVHIKAFKPHPIPHQSDVFVGGIQGYCVLGMLGRVHVPQI